MGFQRLQCFSNFVVATANPVDLFRTAAPSATVAWPMAEDGHSPPRRLEQRRPSPLSHDYGRELDVVPPAEPPPRRTGAGPGTRGRGMGNSGAVASRGGRR